MLQNKRRKKNSKCDKTQKKLKKKNPKNLIMTQKTFININVTKLFEKKTKKKNIVTKPITLNCEEKFRNSNCDKTQKLKLLQNLKKKLKL